MTRPAPYTRSELFRAAATAFVLTPAIGLIPEIFRRTTGTPPPAPVEDLFTWLGFLTLSPFVSWIFLAIAAPIVGALSRARLAGLLPMLVGGVAIGALAGVLIALALGLRPPEWAAFSAFAQIGGWLGAAHAAVFRGALAAIRTLAAQSYTED